MISNRKIIFICFGLFLLNFILKILFISYSEVGLDEPTTIYFAQGSIPKIFEMLRNDNTPPLYYIFLHYWVKLFGIEAFSVRLPSVIFSSLSAVIIFLIGIKHFKLKAGIAASLIYSAATDHIYYAHDARVYALFFLLTCLNLFYFLKIISELDNEKSKLNYVWYIIINIFLCFAHFFGFILVGIELLICLLLLDRKKHFPRLFISFLILLFSYSWYFPYLAWRFKLASKGTWVEKPILTDLYTMLWRFSNIHITTIILIAAIITGLFLLRKQYNRPENINFKILTLLFLFTYFGLFAISYLLPVFIDRYLLFTSLFFYLLAGISLTSLPINQNLLYFISGITIVLMFFSVELKKGKSSNFKEIMEYIRPLSSNKTVFIYPEWNDYSFVYHFNRNWFKDTEHMRDSLKAHSIFPIYGQDDITNHFKTGSFVLMNCSVKDSLFKSFLLSNYSMKEEMNFGPNISVQLFENK